MKIYKTCKAYANKINEITKQLIKHEQLKPSLSIYYVHSAATDAYVRSKCKLASELGISVKVFGFDTPPNLDTLESLIKADDSDAIIIQRPFYSKDEDYFLDCIVPENKDVDGLNPDSWFNPATALGVYWYLWRCTDVLKERNNVCIVGRSSLVGKPLAECLQGCLYLTTTVVHSKTKNVSDYTKIADVIVVAVGKKDFITKDMVKEGALVIDVGINRDDNGKLCGDVAKDVSEIATVTPVPGGVGLLTCAALMQSVANACLWNKRGDLI